MGITIDPKYLSFHFVPHTDVSHLSSHVASRHLSPSMVNLFCVSSTTTSSSPSLFPFHSFPAFPVRITSRWRGMIRFDVSILCWFRLPCFISRAGDFLWLARQMYVYVFAFDGNYPNIYIYIRLEEIYLEDRINSGTVIEIYRDS